MTPSRTINFAIWCIWAGVTAWAVYNAGWVRVFWIGTDETWAFAVGFFTIPSTCYGAEATGWGRHFTEMALVPINLLAIGLAMALPSIRVKTAAAALSLVTIALTFYTVEWPRYLCAQPNVANSNIYSWGDLSHLEGFTTFDIVSLIPRFLFLALFFLVPRIRAPSSGRLPRFATTPL